jgi:iron complex outermembrane receptor protein
LGFRTQLSERANVSIATYYNQYDDVRSTVLDPVTIFPLYFQNGLEGETYGMEISLTYQVSEWWQLASSYNLLREDIRIKEGATDFSNALNETADPGFQFAFRSSFQLPKGFSVNGAFRWIDALPINNSGVLAITPAYAELDGQLAWKASDHITLAISGRNLLHKEHTEYGIPGNNLRAIQRSVYGKITIRLGR